MSVLTEQFCREHSKLVTAMMAVGEQPALTPAVVAEIGEIYRDLKKHMEHEETEVYERLKRAGATNPALKRTLAIFVADTTEISRTILAFFDKYRAGASSDTFRKDYGTMFQAFRTRVRREEEILFKEVDRLAAGPSRA